MDQTQTVSQLSKNKLIHINYLHKYTYVVKKGEEHDPGEEPTSVWMQIWIRERIQALFILV